MLIMLILFYVKYSFHGIYEFDFSTFHFYNNLLKFDIKRRKILTRRSKSKYET